MKQLKVREQKGREQKGRFLGMLATRGASLLGNMLAGK